jgi:hypothetical protein
MGTRQTGETFTILIAHAARLVPCSPLQIVVAASMHFQSGPLPSVFASLATELEAVGAAVAVAAGGLLTATVLETAAGGVIEASV